jgi:hypothetical protein
LLPRSGQLSLLGDAASAVVGSLGWHVAVAALLLQILGFEPRGLGALAVVFLLLLLPPVRTAMRANRHHAGPINRSMWRPNQLRRFVDARQLELLQDFWIVNAEVVETARLKLDCLSAART